MLIAPALAVDNWLTKLVSLTIWSSRIQLKESSSTRHLASHPPKENQRSDIKEEEEEEEIQCHGSGRLTQQPVKQNSALTYCCWCQRHISLHYLMEFLKQSNVWVVLAADKDMASRGGKFCKVWLVSVLLYAWLCWCECVGHGAAFLPLAFESL